MIRLIYALLLTSLIVISPNQTLLAQNTSFTQQDIFGSHFLVENKGQYNRFAEHIDKIDFVLHQDVNEAYINHNGFQFHMLEQKLIKKEDKHNKNNLRNKVITIQEDWFELNWIGANKNPKIEKNERSNHYYTFGDESLNSYGYNSVMYENLYPGVDVKYEVNKKGGIAYSLHITPGAELSNIKFRYSANNDIKTKISNNEIIISNNTGQLVETGLKAFYLDDTPIKIKYYENDGVIGFTTLEHLDKKRSFVIDPWISAATALTGTFAASEGCDVDYDIAGNLLVFGGGGASNSTTNAPKVAKYDGAGNLVWVFAGYIVTPAWNACTISGQIGNFVVDKQSSKIYVSQSYTPSGSRMIRLDPAGNYDNYISTAISQMQEIWEIKFNCNTGDIIAGAGGTNSNLNFGLVDTTTGIVTPSNITGRPSSTQDMACAALDDNGELYTIFAAGIDSFVSNRIYKLDQTYTTSLWDTPTTFIVMQELNNRLNVTLGNYSNGINCLSVNSNYLFYYDGANLKAFDKTNGGAVGSFYSTGLSPKFQYGIYANNCDEVYIGMNNGMIHKLLFNGSNFILQDSLPVLGYPNSSIYDIVYNPIINQLMVSGEGFVASMDPQSNCPQGSNGNLILNYTTHCPDSVSVTVMNATPGDAFTFVWYDSTANMTLSNTTLPIGVATHKIGGIPNASKINVTVIKSSACQIISNDTCFIFDCSIDTTINRITCPGDTIHIGNKIVSVPGVYLDTFLNTMNADSIVRTIYAHYPVYSLTTNATICQGQNYVLPSNISVSSSGTYIDTLQSINGCDSIVTTILTVTPPTPTNIAATICSTDTYTLPNNSTTNIAGIYTDTISTNFGCDSVIVTDLNVISPIDLELGPDTLVCPGQPIILNVTSTANTSYLWQDLSNQSSYSIDIPGTYFVTVSNPPCAPESDTINIADCSCKIFIPNAFSPNGDDRNNIFKPYIECSVGIRNYQLRIFNRWGQNIFYSSNKELGWDGNFKGEPQPIGTYFYTIKFFNPESNRNDLFRGDISLIR